MNIKMSRKWLVSLSVTLGILILLWAIGSAMAQGPEPEEGVSAAATVNSRISYQGVLTESGTPVNGSRNMTFGLYSNDSCTSLVRNLGTKSVTVTDGLFTEYLDVTHSDFNGQGLWLKVTVESTDVDCLEILPAPYALSLRPGAVIHSSTGSAVRGESDGGIGLYGYGDNNYAIQGESVNSVGGYFTSNEGYGIRVKTNGTNHWDHGGYFTANWGYGIYVTSTHNMAIRGEAGDVSGLWQPAGPVGVTGIGEARGVYGSSGDGQGVYGISVNDDGVYGRGENGGSGVYGYSNVGYPHAGVRGVSGDTGMGVYGAGNWGVVGDATSGGTIGGYFYDNVYVAGKLTAVGGVDPLILEGFAADPDRAYEVGDVLCLDEASPYVVPCSQANDTRVVGMVGPNVEIENGELLVVIMGHQGPEPLAGPLETSGDAAGQASLPSRPVVRVKADASYGLIQRGDLLTSSPTLGYAMRAQPVDVGGIEIHRPGTIIGKALEPLTEGQGLIKVFIILQ